MRRFQYDTISMSKEGCQILQAMEKNIYNFIRKNGWIYQFWGRKIGNWDLRIWRWVPSRINSQLSFFEALDTTTAPFPCTSVWMRLSPSKVEDFCWAAVLGIVLMEDNLQKGISAQNAYQLCELCRIENEPVDHLYLVCEYTRSHESTPSLVEVSWVM